MTRSASAVPRAASFGAAMIWATVATLVVTLLGAAPSSVAAPAAEPAARTVTLGGVPVRIGPRTRQVVTVNRRHGHHATVSFWRRTRAGWDRVRTVRDGRIGYGGLVRPKRRRQGTGTTPLGTMRLPWTFGTHRRAAGWEMGHRKLRRGDYWVGDNRSRYYNRFRRRAQGGFRWWLPQSNDNASERLLDYRRQYEYTVTTDYNAGQVRRRGFAIFLHVNGSGATAGCVSAPRGFLRFLYRRLDPDFVPVMAVGR